MQRVELQLPATIYNPMFDALPRFRRLALIGDPRTHFVLHHTAELLLVVVSSDKVALEEMTP